MKRYAPRISSILITLLFCAGACSKSTSERSALDLDLIAVKDTIRFGLNNLKLFPESTNSTNGDYAFSYSDRSFFYVKTINENEGQYAVVKCDLDNKELVTVDISTYVSDFIKMTVDSGLCKSWQACYAFDLETFKSSVVLTINYAGEFAIDRITSTTVVFDPNLKTIDNAGNGDRDTLSIEKLSDKRKIMTKFHGVDTTSLPLFIDNDLLFLSHHGNLYKIDLRSLDATGYKITPAGYNVYPNSTGFFCDYPVFEAQGNGFRHAYSFVAFTDSK